MSKATGFKVNGLYATDYAGVIEAMRFNKVQVAWFGNKSGMEAVDRANGEVFARVVSRDGSVGYYSHIIVHKDSPFAKLEDILKCDKSLDFGIGDPNSTSGFLVPTAYIFAAHNIDPKTCFKTVRNANHQANAMAVANKQVAAATNNSEDLQRVAASAPDARSQIKIIWTSPLIPLDPLVWRKDLDPAVKTKLYTFLMSYGRIGSDEEIKGGQSHSRQLGLVPVPPVLRQSAAPDPHPRSQQEPDESSRRREAVAGGEEPRDRGHPRRNRQARRAGKRKPMAMSFQRRAAAFLEADKAGRQDELKKMIAEFAAGTSGTH